MNQLVKNALTHVMKGRLGIGRTSQVLGLVCAKRHSFSGAFINGQTQAYSTMTRGVLYFKYLKRIILTNAKKVGEKEELCKVGAQDLALALTKNVETSLNAYVSSEFTVGTDVHSIRSHPSGIVYLINELRKGMIKQSAIDKAMSMKAGDRKRLLATLDAEVKTEEDKVAKIESREERDKADAVLEKPKDAKLGKNQVGEDNKVFNRFIDEVMDKIPPNTTTAASVTYNFWINLALGVAHDQPEDYEIKEEDGSKLIVFMDEEVILHEFLLNQKGFIYRVDGKERSFNGYDAIVSDFMKKRNN